MTRLCIGCMTGTSLDGLDAAAVLVEDTGLEMSARVLTCVSRPLASGAGKLGERLRELAEQRPMTAEQITVLARDFALFHAEVIRELLASESVVAAAQVPALICVHGQTVFHRPPHSWQLFNAPVLAAALRTPVIFDLRAADLAAGGQGAPITPIADWILLRAASVPECRAVVNLGGFCNATLLPRASAGQPISALIERVSGFDVCSCNLVLNAVARVLLRCEYDAGGAAALAGNVNEEALEDLDGVLAAQQRTRRSLGTGDEVGEWVSRFRARIPANDMAATAAEAIGRTIARRLLDALPGGTIDRIILAGGGVHNAALTGSIRDWSSAPVELIDGHGVPSGAREAAAMAVLGALCQDRVPITLPAVTGVPSPAPVAGCWAYPP